MNLLNICPMCDGNLEYGEREQTFNYKSKVITVKMFGEFCPVCNESFYNQEDAKKNERNLTLAKRHVDGLLIPEDIARIRKKLGLTQVEASELLGGGVRSFYKYEKGIISPPKALDILLRLLDEGKTTLSDVVSSDRKIA